MLTHTHTETFFLLIIRCKAHFLMLKYNLIKSIGLSLREGGKEESERQK